MSPEALAQIHAQAFTTPRPWSAAEFAALIERPEIDLFYEDQGFAMLRSIAGESELLTIATAPAARRQGIATRLMHALIAKATMRGAEQIFLEVAADNAAAIALYHAHGFAQTGRRKAYYRPPEGPALDALVMARNGSLS